MSDYQFKSKYWRLNNLYYIKNKQGKKVKFHFNDEQQEIWDGSFNEQGLLINDPLINKSRQIGFTTFFVLVYLDDVLFLSSIRAGLILKDMQSIEEIFKIARYAYDQMPDPMKPDLDRGDGSKYEMRFPSRSTSIKVGLEFRSVTMQRLHITERAFTEEDKISASLGAVPDNFHYSSESTPNGLNHYYDDWTDPRSTFKNYFFPWYTHKNYKTENVFTGPFTEEEKELNIIVRNNYGFELTQAQIEWRRIKVKKHKKLYPQEYPETEDDCFLTTGKSFFNLKDMRLLRSETMAPIREEGEFIIFHEYDTRHEYIIGSDVSEGIDQGDASGGICYDKTLGEEAAFFHGKYSPKELAVLLDELGNMYGEALLAVERNNHGHSCLLALDSILSYWNIYCYIKGKLGWLTDQITKPKMLDVLKEGCENRTMKFHNPIFYKECNTFVEEKKKLTALSGKNDDVVMMAGIVAGVISEPNTVGEMTKPKKPGKSISGSMKKNDNW